MVAFVLLVVIAAIFGTSDDNSTEEDTGQGTASVPSSPAPTPTHTPIPTPTLTKIELSQLRLEELDCEDTWFTEQIVKLAEEREDVFSPRILKLYSDVEEIERTDNLLRCMGTAKFSSGGDVQMTYFFEIDRDGDTFIGYAPVSIQ